MPKITYGPMVGVQTEDGYVLQVFFRTNGDWKGTEEGEEALQAAINAFFDPPPGKQLAFSVESEVDFQSDDLAILRIPCKPTKAPILAERLKTELFSLTGAVYTENELSPWMR